jgi:cytochrome c-type biogenesis protein CcmH/NrfF
LRSRRARAGVALLGLLALGAGPIPPGVEPTEFETAARTILCDCGCHPQSVWDCACGRAAQMREDVAAEIRGGMTGGEVIAAYVARYGEKIRIAPTTEGFNLLAWLGPGFGFVVATGLLVLLLRRWQRRGGAEPAAVGPPADPEELARLRGEMERYE